MRVVTRPAGEDISTSTGVSEAVAILICESRSMADMVHKRHTWTLDGTLGIKLKPRSGDKDTAEGVFVAEILKKDMNIPGA